MSMELRAGISLITFRVDSVDVLVVVITSQARAHTHTQKHTIGKDRWGGGEGAHTILLASFSLL